MKNRDQVVNQNLGLVHACATKFRGRGIEYDDLFQAGCMGLVKAVDGFDESLGFKLSTYAVPVILGEIKRLFREGGTVKVSRLLKELSLKVRREYDQFFSCNGREPTINELSEKLNIEPEQIIQALNASMAPVSLTAPDDEKSGQVDIPSFPIEEKLTELLSLKQSINKLEPKDRLLIFLRFFKNNTQTQTAKVLGITQVQVSRRERLILKNLRLALSC